MIRRPPRSTQHVDRRQRQMCIRDSLYSSSCNPLSPLSLPPAPLVIVRLVLTSMSLGIFCLLYWKQPKCPSANEWIKKLWYIYTMEFYAADRRKEQLPLATAWMELESIMLSEISQPVKEKYHMISPISGT